MAEAARASREYPLRRTVDDYFELVHRGVLRPDDRVELLEGIIVAKDGHDPPHANAITRAYRLLQRLVGDRAIVRIQLPLIVGPHSAPEPDVAVVPGQDSDYEERHPTTASLIVEVADSSLAQDRLTKAAMYARAGIPEYWIVNLVDGRVEVFREPVRKKALYARTTIAGRGDEIELAALPGVRAAVDDLLPPPKR